MNIITEQLESLRLPKDASQPGRAGQTSQSGSLPGSFDSILTSQLGSDTAREPVSSILAEKAGQAGLIARMLLGDTGGDGAQDSETALFDAAFAQASGTLDLFDSYALSIGNGGNADLRQSYSLLEGIDSQVRALRQSTTALRGKNQDFDTLLNNLEAMAVTEKFKFNRGDYMA